MLVLECVEKNIFEGITDIPDVYLAHGKGFIQHISWLLFSLKTEPLGTYRQRKSNRKIFQTDHNRITWLVLRRSYSHTRRVTVDLIIYDFFMYLFVSKVIYNLWKNSKNININDRDIHQHLLLRIIMIFSTVSNLVHFIIIWKSNLCL